MKKMLMIICPDCQFLSPSTVPASLPLQKSQAFFLTDEDFSRMSGEHNENSAKAFQTIKLKKSRGSFFFLPISTQNNLFKLHCFSIYLRINFDFCRMFLGDVLGCRGRKRTCFC